MTEDLTELAIQLGYGWPDDDEGRWRVLKLMATTAAYWRRESERCQSEMEQQRRFELKIQRIAALSRKLANVRRALKDFMKSQAAFVREGLAEIREL